MADRPLILHITSEMYPFSKTGGLADVLGALPPALAEKGVDVAVVTPFYGRLSTAGYPVRLLHSDVPVGYPWPPTTAEVFHSDYQGVPVYFISRGEYFDRRFYYNTHRGDYFDNCERFVFFCRAALEWCKFMGRTPDVVHAHDWQAALSMAYLHYWRQIDPFWKDVKTVLTIHNLAFQGRYSSRLFWECGLPTSAWNMDGAEFWGDFNMLKAGIAYADHVTTVSPSYAEEVQTEAFGCGLEGILRKRSADLTGILNGADYDVWDPRGDKYLPHPYCRGNMKGKRICKEHLLREYGMDPIVATRPLLGFIGRLRRQKGIDLLLDILPALMKIGVGVVVLGEGNLEFEAQLMELTEKYQGRLAARIGYTEELAHYIQAGTDIFLMPSRYEPCGLTQMYSLRFGTVPIASAVGGLRDTIVPYPRYGATGFTFAPGDPSAFLRAIMDALSVWDKPKKWTQLRSSAMKASFSWPRSAEGYLAVYKKLGVTASDA